VYAADMDGDGRVDVLSASRFDDKIAWYRNLGGAPPIWTPYTISTTADFAVSVHAADVDSDGRMDVLSGSFSDNKVALYTNNMCPRGTSGPGGYAPCTPCPAGRYSNDSLQASCTLCPGGRYGTMIGAMNATSGCGGSCSAGYACPPGSASAMAIPCPAGFISSAGASACSPCVAGTFSDRQGRASCTVCPLYTTSSFSGATTCLPSCPIAGQLSVGCV
jgi:hypothetical protein